MKSRIIKHLKQLEVDKQIKILLAVETGSRAWGFPSPDSDYDIRLIYVKPMDWYLKVSEGKDHLEYMSEDREIDLTGWELRKALRLMAKSNGALLERIQSPIIYLQEGDFAKDMKQLSSNFCSPISLIHHYFSMALKSVEPIKDQKSFKLKALFYSIRATAACLWILEHKSNPPIVFSEMLEGLSIEAMIKKRIAELTQLKSSKNESYLHEGESILIHFILKSLETVGEKKSELKGGRGNMEDLNELLRRKIMEKWN